MAVTTTIARHYAWRNLIFAAVCLILGLWGVYDYAIAIPAQERSFERGRVCRLVKEAMEPGGWSESAQPARQAVSENLERLLEEHLSPDAVKEMEEQELRTLDEQSLRARAAEFERAIESIMERKEEGWFTALLLFDEALKAGEPAVYPLTGIHLLAHDIAEQGIQQVANISQPSAYDRPTQWLFILCLPFVPWSLWVYFRTKARVYRLDDDGTLHMHGRTWNPSDIADIHMDRWMSKSIAVIKHTDGQRVVLDDYKHKNLHLIVGAVANRLYPDQWTTEAKPVAAETESEAPAEPVETDEQDDSARS
jgi:hypothetical protein